MVVKITEQGEKLIRKNIEKLQDEIKFVRDEKNIAYTLCGDTWHDNPHFNKLEQDERILDQRIREVEQILATAERIELTTRNTEEVAIGSIVKCYCEYPEFEEEEVYEIVGYGESNLDENKLVYDSPVASNLIGLKMNESVTFETPTGKVTFKVLQLFENWDSIYSK